MKNTREILYEYVSRLDDGKLYFVTTGDECWYPAWVPLPLIEACETIRRGDIRVRLWYADEGESELRTQVGYIYTTVGRRRSPLLVFNSSSSGDDLISFEGLLKIDESRQPHHVFWDKLVSIDEEVRRMERWQAKMQMQKMARQS